MRCESHTVPLGGMLRGQKGLLRRPKTTVKGLALIFPDAYGTASLLPIAEDADSTSSSYPAAAVSTSPSYPAAAMAIQAARCGYLVLRFSSQSTYLGNRVDEAQAALDYLRQLGGDKNLPVIFMGFAAGAALATRFACDLPKQSVQGLLVISPEMNAAQSLPRCPCRLIYWKSESHLSQLAKQFRRLQNGGLSAVSGDKWPYNVDDKLTEKLNENIAMHIRGIVKANPVSVGRVPATTFSRRVKPIDEAGERPARRGCVIC